MDTKKWFRSKGVWGSLIAGAAVVAGFFGIQFGIEDQAELVEIITTIVGGAAALIGMYGRITASTVIKPTE